MIVVDDGKKLRLVGAIRFRAQLLMMPGQHGWKHDQFFCEPTRANVEFLECEFPSAEWKSAELQRVRDLRKTEEAIGTDKRYDVDDYPMKTTPFDHQLEAFAKSKNLNYYAYLMEMGTGKTKVLIDNAGYLWWDGKIEALILVAPNGVHRQFVTEQLPIHMSDTVMEDVDAFVYQSGGNKAFQKRRAEFLRPSKKFRILAINVESLSVKSGYNFVIDFLKSIGAPGTVRPVMMAVDESTRIKNHTASRSKNVYRLGTYCRYRRILSGSPVTRGVEDLFGQFAFLSPDITGFKSFYTFRNRYCVMKDGAPNGSGGSNYKVVVGYQNVEELKRKIKPWSHRVLKSECLDLPPKVYVRREVGLSEQQRQLYNQLRREMFLELENRTLTATMAAVRLTKLQQILCGHVRFTDEGVTEILPNIPRIDAVKELVEEAQGQVIVWARFQPDITRLCEELKQYGVSRYDGLVDNKDRPEQERLFKEGHHKVMVSNPAVGATGRNWQCSNCSIYYSNSFDAEHRWQSEDRNHRSGTVNTVTYYDLVVPGSIDSYIINVLARKKDVASMTVDDFKEMVRDEL